MKRTQLYLDDDLWNALRIRSREEGTTVSELVRRAARERYLATAERREEAMMAFVGLRKDREEFADSEAYVRELRRGTRRDKALGP